jgi:putative transcriptional regulator
LADEIGVMPSVISDYENGRRKSPGIKVVKRMVNALISVDERAGGKIIREFASFPTKAVLSDAIIDMREFGAPVSIKEFCKGVDAHFQLKEDAPDTRLHGYAVIDSLKAVVEISPAEMVRLHSLATDRALVFVGAHTGKSTMVGIKVGNIRPGLVVLHGSDGLDELAQRIAQIESIPVALSKIKGIDELLGALRKLGA